MWTQFRIDGNMPTQYVVSTARDWAVRCTVAEGYNGFTCAFQNLRKKFSTAIATFNFQPWFVISASKHATAIFNVLLQFQPSTGDSVFQHSTVIPTVNCDWNFQLWLQFSTAIAMFNCDCNVQLRLQFSTAITTFNCDCNVQLRFQFSTVIATLNCNCNSQLWFNSQPWFNFSTLNCDSNF